MTLLENLNGMIKTLDVTLGEGGDQAKKLSEIMLTVGFVYGAKAAMASVVTKTRTVGIERAQIQTLDEVMALDEQMEKIKESLPPLQRDSLHA